MDETTTMKNVTVHLIGGPPCWSGLAIENVYDHEEIYEVPFDELGALLTVPVPEQRPPHSPARTSPRAVYEPLPGGRRDEWHFVGWENTMAALGA
ncbi:hypothetical protein [Nocardiopsis alkaliphila]|uniref:hypothetical protein n=1 Tax=Nocardiopsis alkaliphila TaxID=225762 RepID=UPI000349C040|nr:hypothetical protein [Nocardiopsis alkaliphila]